MMSGNCCYVPPGMAGDAGTTDAGTSALPTAGTLTVKDGPNTIATIMPMASGAYSDTSTMDMGLKWAAGDMLTFSAAGDKVHAFMGTVTVPEDIAGLNPPLSITMPATVSVGGDWVLSWTAGSAGSDKMELLVTALKNGATADGIIVCTGMDSDAKITVPKAILGMIGSSDTGFASLTRASVDMPSDDNATVTIQASTSASGTLKYGP